MLSNARRCPVSCDVPNNRFGPSGTSVNPMSNPAVTHAVLVFPALPNRRGKHISRECPSLAKKNGLVQAAYS